MTAEIKDWAEAYQHGISALDAADAVWAEPDDTTPTAAPPPNLKTINPADWEGKPIPARPWIVEDFIPDRTVTELSGAGGKGKTGVGLQLCAAMALGRDWLGLLPTPGRSLFLSCEDEADELHRRLNGIREHYRAEWADLQDMRLADLVGEYAVMGELVKGGTLKATPFYEAVIDHIAESRPKLIAIDARADAFAGDENNRAQVRQFVNLLKGPARDYDCAILLIAHPSLTGIASGTGSSGSTDWGNAVRSRLYFEAATAADGSEPDPDLRQLTTKKANYGPTGNSVVVRWQNGVFVPEKGETGLDKMALEQRAIETFLALVRRFNAQGQDVSSKRGPTYAPTVFAKHPDADGIGKAHLERAMQTLLDEGRISIETFGPPSRQRTRLIMGKPC